MNKQQLLAELRRMRDQAKQDESAATADLQELRMLSMGMRAATLGDVIDLVELRLTEPGDDRVERGT